MTEEESGVRRWLVDISSWRPFPAQFDAAAALLPPHERPAIARFVKEDDRKRALVSRLLQYSLVHHVLGIPFHQIDIRRTTEGKPYLQDNCSDFLNFNFSTSHQGDYVGIASEPLCLVGLDIVSVSEPHGETVAEFVSNFRSMSGAASFVLALPGTCSQSSTGAGVGFGFRRLEFHHEGWTNIYICIDGEVSKKWRFWLFKLDETHLASIAKGDPEDAINTFKKTLSNVTIADKQLSCALDSPEEAFTLWTVEELIQSQE